MQLPAPADSWSRCADTSSKQSSDAALLPSFFTTNNNTTQTKHNQQQQPHHDANNTDGISMTTVFLFALLFFTATSLVCRQRNIPHETNQTCLLKHVRSGSHPPPVCARPRHFPQHTYTHTQRAWKNSGKSQQLPQTTKCITTHAPRRLSARLADTAAVESRRRRRRLGPRPVPLADSRQSGRGSRDRPSRQNSSRGVATRTVRASETEIMVARRRTCVSLSLSARLSANMNHGDDHTHLFVCYYTSESLNKKLR